MEVNYSFQEFKDIIMFGKRVFYSKNPCMIYYNNLLFSIDEELCKLVKRNKILNDSQFEVIGHNFNNIDINKLNLLLEKQNSIKLSKLPLGLLLVNNIPIGLVLPYFKGYRWLHSLEDEDEKDLALIARKVFSSLCELMDNGIYRLNVNHSNVFYNGISSELVDLYGKKLVCDGRDLSSDVYCDYTDFFRLLVRQGKNAKLVYKFKDLYDNDDYWNYDNCEELVKRLEKK